MKKILLTGFIFALFISIVFSQDGDHIGGGHYTKTIEYNLLRPIIGYNYNSKSDVEKLFFGNFNATLEFFYGSDEGVFSGFRIIRDTLRMSYFLEIKNVSNYREAIKEAAAKYPPTMPAASAVQIDSRMSAKDSIDLREMQKKYFEERNKLFIIESHSFRISDKFAEKLYKEMVSIIDNFKARGIPPFINGGYSVTFRAAVEDNELWTLKIHVPTGNALKMSDICRQILKDANENKFDEKSYIKLLYGF